MMGKNQKDLNKRSGDVDEDENPTTQLTPSKTQSADCKSKPCEDLDLVKTFVSKS